ncbi:MAG TPA: signal peptide peptidase SppA [bacterium]|nr:signal peptide peptidase SppA [bacterium]
MRRGLFVSIVLVVALVVGLCGCYVKFPTFGERIRLSEQMLEKAKGTKDKILLVPLSGIISSSSSRGAFSSQDNLVEVLGMQLDKAKKDKHIKGLILTVNSPGGAVTASEIIYHKIAKFKKEKGVPVVVLMGDVAASGGYYISMAGDKIIAHPTTITGSIGVISMFFNLQGLFGKIGVDVVTLKTGAMKDVGSFARPMEPEEKVYIMAILEQMYGVFLDRVLANRTELTREELLKLADGRVFTASQALEAKLIDQIGYFEDAVSAVKEKGNFSAASVVAYEWPWNHKYDVYSATAPGRPIDINLLKLDLGTLDSIGRPGFYYIWTE